MTLYDATRDYLNALRHEQGASATTHTTYQSRLNAFLRWLSENGYPEPGLDVFTLPILRRYVYVLSERGNRPRTIRSCFNTMRSFGAFLVSVGVLTENPAKAVTLPKLDAAIRLTVTDEEVAALFEACDRLAKPRQIAMARAVLAALCYGGLRRAEVYNLRMEDVHVKEKSLLIRSCKGNKSRRIFLCADAINAFREWYALRGPCKHDWLFAYDRNRRLHDEGIAALLETIKAAAGLRDNPAIKPHSLRHWCATNLLRNGANLRDVQQFLGHSDLMTTAKYLHSNEEQLRSISELTALRPKAQESAHHGKAGRLLHSQETEQRRMRRITR